MYVSYNRVLYNIDLRSLYKVYPISEISLTYTEQNSKNTHELFHYLQNYTSINYCIIYRFQHYLICLWSNNSTFMEIVMKCLFITHPISISEQMIQIDYLFLIFKNQFTSLDIFCKSTQIACCRLKIFLTHDIWPPRVYCIKQKCL